MLLRAYEYLVSVPHLFSKYCEHGMGILAVGKSHRVTTYARGIQGYEGVGVLQRLFCED